MINNDTMNKAIKITETCDGKQVEGSCSYSERSMVVVMTNPFPNISTAHASMIDLTDEHAEKLSKELLVKLYEDCKSILDHQDEIRAALPEFYRQRAELKDVLDEETKAKTLFAKMLHGITGRWCGIDAMEAKVTGMLDEPDYYQGR